MNPQSDAREDSCDFYILVHLLTKLWRKMTNRLVPLFDQLLLRKRTPMETIVDQLKNISPIEQTRHCSGWNFLGDLLAGLIAYTRRPVKPSLDIRPVDRFLPLFAC